MALFKYFKVQKDWVVPRYLLSLNIVSKLVDRGAIEAANEEVMAMLKTD